MQVTSKPRKKRIPTFNLVNGFLLSLLIVICFIPIMHLVSLSLSKKIEAVAGNVGIIPRGFNIEAYRYVMEDSRFWRSLKVTLLRVGIGVPANILLVVLTAVSILRGEEDVHIFGRRIENDLLRRACSIVVVYFTMGMLATLAICAVQPEFTLQQVLIEVFSAIDTVGLTTGITRDLNTFSRIVIIMLMYAGRLGSMTFIILLTRRKPPAPVQYPTDKVIIG